MRTFKFNLFLQYPVMTQGIVMNLFPHYPRLQIFKPHNHLGKDLNTEGHFCGTYILGQYSVRNGTKDIFQIMATRLFWYVVN